MGTHSEQHIKLKLRQLDCQLRSNFNRATFHFYLNGNQPEITGSKILTDYLTDLYNRPCACDRESLKEAVTRAAQAAALEETLETSKARQPTQKLKAPLSFLSFNESLDWLIFENKKDYWAGGFGSKVNYNYNSRNPESCREHELKRPTAWPEDLIEWLNVTVGIEALGANLANIPKSDNCPTTAIEL